MWRKLLRGAGYLIFFFIPAGGRFYEMLRDPDNDNLYYITLVTGSFVFCILALAFVFLGILLQQEFIWLWYEFAGVIWLIGLLLFLQIKQEFG
jgi:uncharacterized membrane protein YgdD (TMEM256/DUF423 family)